MWNDESGFGSRVILSGAKDLISVTTNNHRKIEGAKNLHIFNYQTIDYPTINIPKLPHTNIRNNLAYHIKSEILLPIYIK